MEINYKLKIDLDINVTSTEHCISNGNMYLSYSADEITSYYNDMILGVEGIENSIDLTKGGGCDFYNTASFIIRNKNNWVYYAKQNGCKFKGNKVTLIATKDSVDTLIYSGGISECTSNETEVYITTDDLNQFIYDEDESNKITRSIYNTCGGTEINGLRLISQLEPFNILNFYGAPSYKHAMTCLSAEKSPDGELNVKNKYGSTLSNLSNILTVSQINPPIYTRELASTEEKDENSTGLIICRAVISATDYTALGFSTLADYVAYLNTGWEVDTNGMPKLARIISDGTLEKIIPLRGNSVNKYSSVDEILNNVMGFSLESDGTINFYFSTFIPIEDLSVGDTLCLIENHTVQNIEDEVDIISTSTIFDSDYYDNSAYSNNLQFKNRTTSYNLCDVVKNEYQDVVDLTETVQTQTSSVQDAIWKTVGFSLTEDGPWVGNSFSNSVQTMGASSLTAPETGNLKLDQITRSNIRVIGENNIGGSNVGGIAKFMAHKVTIPIDSSVIPLDLDQLENFKFCFSMGDFTTESHTHLGFIFGGKFGDESELPATKIKLIKIRNTDEEIILATWTKNISDALVDPCDDLLLDEPFSTGVKSVTDDNIHGYYQNTHNFTTTILSNDNRELSHSDLNNMPTAYDFERALFTQTNINKWTYTASTYNGYSDSSEGDYYVVVEFNTGMYISTFYDNNIAQYFSLNFAGIANVLDVNDIKVSGYTNDDQYDFDYIPANMLNQVGLLSDTKLATYKNTGFNSDYSLPTGYNNSYTNGLNNDIDSVFTIIDNICQNTPCKVISQMNNEIKIIDLFKLINEDNTIDHVIDNFANIKSDTLVGTGTNINFTDKNSTLSSEILGNYLPITIDTNYADKVGLESVNALTTSLYLASEYQEAIAEFIDETTNILKLTLNWFALNPGTIATTIPIITNLFNYLGDYLKYIATNKSRISFDVSMEDYLDNNYAIGDMIQLNDGIIYSDSDIMICMVSSVKINDLEDNNVTIQSIQTISSGDIISSFSLTPEKGETPLTVTFSDESFGTPISWEWYYKLNSEETWTLFSTLQNPVYIFDDTFTDGEYDIRLVVNSAEDTSIRTKTSALKLGSTYVLDADFTVDTTSGEAPLTVNFTDTSTGSPDTWEWKINGKAFSTLQNPTYVFNPYAGQEYSISLTISKNDEISTKTYINIIEVDTYSLLTNEDENLTINT